MRFVGYYENARWRGLLRMMAFGRFDMRLGLWIIHMDAWMNVLDSFRQKVKFCSTVWLGLSIPLGSLGDEFNPAEDDLCNTVSPFRRLTTAMMEKMSVELARESN